ncbi:hypothetical protein K440DRAFT_661519 [Wilcoxina mikolae CBS 423.85]|nr:hypothetical protein K440DRAFT_661519 [Wilcoxina mikolae CBS 423.85]
MHLLHILIPAIFAATTFAFPRPPSESEDPCASLATLMNQSVIVPATAALNCLKSVPFSEPEAVELISNLRLFTNFIASQGYYPTPTNPSLGIPPFNINSTIDTIESRARSGSYNNGFEFWREVSLAYTGFRDGHMAFQPLCGGSVFSWYHEYPIVSIGGREIYTIVPDTKTSNSSGSTLARLDKKVTHINGQDSVEFLLEMSKIQRDLFLYFDEDVRWNALMTWPSNTAGVFANRTHWAGEEEEKLHLTFESGEEVTVEWKAVYSGSGVFTDTKSFTAEACYLHPELYKFQSPKVAGPLWKDDPTGDKYTSEYSSVLSKIASSTETSTATTTPVSITEIPTSSATTTDAPTSPVTDFPTPTTSLVGYPTPLARGPDDTLIFFPDPDNSPSVAVLQIPTFEVADNATTPWHAFLNATLTTLGSRGVSKLVIDVSDNPGGNIELPKRVMRMLFPKSLSGVVGTEPEYNFEWRYHSALAKMVRATADDYTPHFAESRFVNLTGGNFSSIDEILGPYYDSKPDDYFTTIGIPRANLLTPDLEGLFPWKNFFAKEDVVVFGVRSYALGGRGGYRNMQAVGGTKTGVVVNYDVLVPDTFKMFGDTTDQKDLPKFPATLYGRASLSMENAFRPGADEIPLFFTYTPACRKIPMTKEMATDINEVWRVVKKVAWGEGQRTGCDPEDSGDGGRNGRYYDYQRDQDY